METQQELVKEGDKTPIDSLTQNIRLEYLLTGFLRCVTSIDLPDELKSLIFAQSWKVFATEGIRVIRPWIMHCLPKLPLLVNVNWLMNTVHKFETNHKTAA